MGFPVPFYLILAHISNLQYRLILHKIRRLPPKNCVIYSVGYAICMPIETVMSSILSPYACIVNSAWLKYERVFRSLS